MKLTAKLPRTIAVRSAGPGSCERLCDDYRREARLVQSSLFPTSPLLDPAAVVTFHYIPFSEVSGDLAEFFRLPNGLIGCYLGDVVGKGLPAAMYGALVMGTFRGIHKNDVDPADVLGALNRRLMQRPIPGRFCCALYALFNPATRSLLFSNAGLPLPLLISHASCQELGEGGFPPGMFPTSTYQQHSVQLSPGDSVLFATDGVHEIRDREGIEIRTAQIADIWEHSRRTSAETSIQSLFRGLKEFSNGTDLQDDATAILLQLPTADAALP